MAPEVLPMRPMTAGELLDAGAALLRRRALPMLALAAPLAAAEQVLLGRWREGAGLGAPTYMPDFGDFGTWWTITAAGLGIEAAIIALLGAYAGAAAGPALLGKPVKHRALWSRTRPIATITATAFLGISAAMAAYAGFVPWLILYGLTGFVTAALTLNRTNRPLRRSARLAIRDGARPALIRLLAYFTFFLIRFALGTAWVAVAGQAGWSIGTSILTWAVPIAWGIANTVAYAALACLDAALLVEARIRTEGLDIEIERERARGGDGSRALVDAS
ncbi:hypothetical protein ACTI_61660 [Actinoplanes sp. OR16]|uniref:hypothetical protein n=1 Tax=Actinoplanes sp. OR16 TaxID=946334 RepID=UPI000F6B4627|nr:hypothetical protein [Actinoplanes sp. OR16]BBH69481.1 hypothetical protein ACTI_61660 [Actinoplanes sp. OR16]